MSKWFSLKKKTKLGDLGFDAPDSLKTHPDDDYIRLAIEAADRDKQSGAYDEFLFSEDGLPKMPFEDVVDDRLDLTAKRLDTKLRQAAHKAESQKLEVQVKVKAQEFKLRGLKAREDHQREILKTETQILRKGAEEADGVKWPGEIPDTSNWMAVGLKLFGPVLLFIGVAVADINIVVMSFTNIHGFTKADAWIFSIPAVGIQLAFPHLLGERIGLLTRGLNKKTNAIIQSAALGTVWLGFCYIMALIRMNFISERYGMGGMPQGLYYAMLVGNFLMLLGLGSTLMLMGAHRNKHETAYVRADVALRTLQKRIIRQEAKIAKLQAQVPLIEDAKQYAVTSYKTAIDTARSELLETTKSVYRRALVNAIGDVEFTNSYLRPENGYLRTEK